MRDSAEEKLSVAAPQVPAKILIVDDHPMVREGLTMRISAQADLKVCGEAETEEDALALATELDPDLMLIDISLKSGHGIELVKRIKAQLPAVKMLIVSGFQASLYAERAWRAGALGYLNKQESNDKVLEAIYAVLAGKLYFNSDTTQRLFGQDSGNADMSANPISELTDRELEIFRMIGEGLTSGVIANRLFISSHTIDTHRENIKRKLGLKTAGELTRAAVQMSLENG